MASGLSRQQLKGLSTPWPVAKLRMSYLDAHLRGPWSIGSQVSGHSLFPLTAADRADSTSSGPSPLRHKPDSTSIKKPGPGPLAQVHKRPGPGESGRERLPT